MPRLPEPGESGFRCVVQKNLKPGETPEKRPPEGMSNKIID